MTNSEKQKPYIYRVYEPADAVDSWYTTEQEALSQADCYDDAMRQIEDDEDEYQLASVYKVEVDDSLIHLSPLAMMVGILNKADMFIKNQTLIRGDGE